MNEEIIKNGPFSEASSKDDRKRSIQKLNMKEKYELNLIQGRNIQCVPISLKKEWINSVLIRSRSLFIVD